MGNTTASLGAGVKVAVGGGVLALLLVPWSSQAVSKQPALTMTTKVQRRSTVTDFLDEVMGILT